MSNHPNRGRNSGPASTPTAEAAAALVASVSGAGEASKLLYTTRKTVERWCAGERSIHPAFFELLEIKKWMYERGLLNPDFSPNWEILDNLNGFKDK